MKNGTFLSLKLKLPRLNMGSWEVNIDKVNEKLNYLQNV